MLLSNGTLYTSWTSHCDGRRTAAGSCAYSASTLARTRVLNVAPNSTRRPCDLDERRRSGGGFAGNIYLLTANGAFETTLDANGFPSSEDYGNSFLKISNRGGSLERRRLLHDVQRSGGVASRPGSGLGRRDAAAGPDGLDQYRAALMVGAGKDGNIYVVNRDSMGKFNATANNI